jgi:hypothetical protein
MIPSRRQFIQTGLAGSLLLSVSRLAQRRRRAPLSDAEREMLGALTNALLDGALPARPCRPQRRLVP